MAKAVGHLTGKEDRKIPLKGGDIMVIKVEYNFKLHKFSITIKKDRSAGPETVKSADKR